GGWLPGAVRVPALSARGVPGPGPGMRCTALQIASGPTERPVAQGVQGAGGTRLRVDRGPARAQRLLPSVPGWQDAVAAQATVGFVEQHGRAAGGAAGEPGRGPGRDPGIPVLHRG